MQTDLSLNVRVEQKDVNIENFEFEPIRGYPMLRWQGKRPFTSTQFYPAQLKETYGEETEGWMNQIFWGDNLQVMSYLLKKFRGQVDLIYIDPPFDSKADYKKKIQLRGRDLTNDATAFEEKQYTDIWSNDEYLQFMYERLILLRELLSEKGSIYLHCDWHKAHYLRAIMDEIFGYNNFRNDITWVRTASHNDTTGKFSRVKDTILFYSKANDISFNIQYVDYDQSYIDSEWNLLPSGRYWKSENMLDPRGAMKLYDFHGTVARWRTSPEKLEELWNAPQTEVPNSHGRIKLGRNGKPIKRCRIMFLDELPGVPLSDNWTDISYLGGGSKESQKYPTQKPEALLDRIIKSSTNAGDLIFDCFMGSGTTQAVAMKLGRRFIGADINLGAIQTTTKRLIKVADNLNTSLGGEKVYTGFQVYNVNHYDLFRNPLEAKELLMRALEIEPAPTDGLFDGEKDGRMVKVMPINRIATRADLNVLLSNIDLRAYENRKNEIPNRPVESITLVCMGHEPDLAAQLKSEVKSMGYTIDVNVVDILRDRSKLEFKRDAEAVITFENNQLVIHEFYPMNLLQKLSLMKEDVGNWKELVESILIDWNYDGAVLEPTTIDVPDDVTLVRGFYAAPANYGTIRIKITDLLSESLELTVESF